jgi:hypothetical protein
MPNGHEEDEREVTKYGLSILENLSRKLAEGINSKAERADSSIQTIRESHSSKIDLIFSTMLSL